MCSMASAGILVNLPSGSMRHDMQDKAKRLSHVVLPQLLDRAREKRVELGGEVSHFLAGRVHGGGLEVPLL